MIFEVILSILGFFGVLFVICFLHRKTALEDELKLDRELSEDFQKEFELGDDSREDFKELVEWMEESVN